MTTEIIHGKIKDLIEHAIAKSRNESKILIKEAIDIAKDYGDQHLLLDLRMARDCADSTHPAPAFDTKAHLEDALARM